MVVEKVFAVIAESTRRDILEALAQESKAVGQLVDELGVSQPTVSKHLRVLREAGVVTMRAQGQKRFYGINIEPLALVSTWLESLGAGHAGADVAGANGSTKAAVPPISGAARADGAANIRRDGPESKASQAASQAAEPAAAAVLRSAAAGHKHETAPSAAHSPSSAPSASGVPVSGAPAVAVPGAPVSTGLAAAAAAAVPQGTHPAQPARNAAGKPAGPAETQVAQQTQPVGMDHDGGVPRQLGRSVGRAAKKGADLLATFKRRKD